MCSVLNSTDYPIILDGDESAAMMDRLNGFSANVTRVFSEDRSGEKVYVGMATERAEGSIRAGMSRYSYTGYGFPESVETDSAMTINMIVVLSVREWAELNRMPRGLVAPPF